MNILFIYINKQKNRYCEGMHTVNMKTFGGMINTKFSSGSLCDRKYVGEERRQESIYKEMQWYG